MNTDHLIATNIGYLPEIVERGRTGFVVNPRRANEIAQAVVRFYEEAKDTFSWDRLVETIEGFL